MPKFDVVVGNPPYLRGLHLKFLELAYAVSKKNIIFIQPATWILTETPSCLKTKNLIVNKVKSVTFLNGNPEFGIIMASPLSIICIDKDSESNDININDPINNINYSVNDINLVNKWGDIKIYPNLKNKMGKISLRKNLGNISERHKYNSKYYIVISMVRGNTDFKTPNKLVKSDFYTLIGKSDKIKTCLDEKNLKSKRQNLYGFDSLAEAQNCFHFLKTKWARFGLSINKFDKALQRSEVKYIPWLDWSEPWSEERFEKLIDATPEEIEFVKKNIPDYYGIESINTK